jgi:F-type H+-transporting ATPase subunit b
MLNIDWGLMVWTLITFALAVVILWKYAFGPLQGVIDERRAQIRESLETAEATREEAARLLEEYKETLASVRAEAEEILDRSRKAGEATRSEIVGEARGEAERAVAKGQEQIERDMRAALKEIREQIADLTMQATEKVIGKSLTDADQRRLLDEALRDLDLDELGVGRGE